MLNQYAFRDMHTPDVNSDDVPADVEPCMSSCRRFERASWSSAISGDTAGRGTILSGESGNCVFDNLLGSRSLLLPSSYRPSSLVGAVRGGADAVGHPGAEFLLILGIGLILGVLLLSPASESIVSASFMQTP